MAEDLAGRRGSATHHIVAASVLDRALTAAAELLDANAAAEDPADLAPLRDAIARLDPADPADPAGLRASWNRMRRDGAEYAASNLQQQTPGVPLLIELARIKGFHAMVEGMLNLDNLRRHDGDVEQWLRSPEAAKEIYAKILADYPELTRDNLRRALDRARELGDELDRDRTHPEAPARFREATREVDADRTSLMRFVLSYPHVIRRTWQRSVDSLAAVRRRLDLPPAPDRAGD